MTEPAKVSLLVELTVEDPAQSFELCRLPRDLFTMSKVISALQHGLKVKKPLGRAVEVSVVVRALGEVELTAIALADSIRQELTDDVDSKLCSYKRENDDD